MAFSFDNSTIIARFYLVHFVADAGTAGSDWLDDLEETGALLSKFPVVDGTSYSIILLRVSQELSSFFEASTNLTSRLSMNTSLLNRSILKSVIEDSIVAFPQDAHQYVLKYLLEGGLEESQTLKFRQAWSKVVLSSQAFGKSSQGNNVNPALFSEELIQELSQTDDIVASIVISCASAKKLNTQNKSPLMTASDSNNSHPRDGVVSLDAIQRLGEDLATLLTNLYQNATPLQIHEEAHQIELLESIGLFRKSLRGTRILWSGIQIATKDGYVPLDSAVHGLPDLKKGRIDMQLRGERNDLNAYMSTDELFGVAISSKQAVHQERGWNAYQCLTELLSSRGLNIFPLPIGVQRDPVSLVATFAFESTPGAILLRHLQGPTLSTYLRRVPVVIHHWCAQLGAAYRSLQTCSGSLTRPVRAFRDVFVREDGLLLIGNAAFDASPPSRKPRQGDTFLRMACDVLQASLCLSRTECVYLLDDSRGSDADKSESGGDVILAVVVGSCLQLNVEGHRCSSVSVENSTRAHNQTRKENPNTYRNVNRGPDTDNSAAEQPRAPPSISTLSVDIAVSTGTYQQYVAVDTVGQTSSSSAAIKISALQAGVLSLHISALVQDDDGSGTRDAEPRIRLRGCRVKVVIVPAYSVMSVPLLDLIGHLEEVQQQNQPRILLNSQLFKKLHSVQNAESKTASSFVEKTLDVQKGWQDIKRVIDNYGNMHTPAK